MKKKGFTLIELLLVVAIVGVLAAVAIPKLLAAISKSKEAAMYSDMKALTAALNVYITEHISNKYPIVPTSSKISTSLVNLVPTYCGTLPKAPYEKSSGLYAYEYFSPDGYNYTITGYLLFKPHAYTIQYCIESQLFTKF